ncbi:MAG: J domain-containing protein, partial [Syntrophothermus sp.]
GFTDFGDFSDFFNSFFSGNFTSDFGSGRGRRKESAPRGEDYEAKIIISLHEAYTGAKRMITINGQSINITIPPGVRNGQVLRVKGKGGSSRRGGDPGHLFLSVEMQDDPRFTRENDDLHVEVDVPVYTAVLGGEIKVPTMKGFVSMKIPPETRRGKIFRLKGLGMPVYQKKNEFGDLYLKVSIDIPEKLSPLELELFRKLADMRK